MTHITLLDLSRRRWALTAAMHITFPAVAVGTSVFEHRDTLLRALV
jgi:cytochrome bd-type quinol oxidase subunit 1